MKSVVTHTTTAGAGQASELLTRVAELESQLAAQRQRFDDLGSLGAIIASILEIDQALSAMMEIALENVAGEVGAILLDEDGELKCRLAWGMDHNLLNSIRLADGRTVTEAYKSDPSPRRINQQDLCPDVGLKINSLLIAPIQSRQRTLGFLVVLNKRRGEEFSADDLTTLVTLNNFLAVALENAHLLSEKLEKQRMEQELSIAHEVQQTILPETDFTFEGFDIAARYVAANEVGGDFYELIPTADSGFVLVIGDVSNKGVGSALVMSACAGIIKSTLRTSPDIAMSDLASHLNDTLAEEIVKDHGMFATIWFGRFSSASGELTYCNAGHIPPVLCRGGSQEVEELSLGGAIIGQFAGLPFKQGAAQLQAGDSITLCTDGLTEAENTGGELFGRVRLSEFVRDHSSFAASEFCDALQLHLEKYSRGASAESSDDFTAIHVRIQP